jgi:hypothetical protein
MHACLSMSIASATTLGCCIRSPMVHCFAGPWLRIWCSKSEGVMQCTRAPISNPRSQKICVEKIKDFTLFPADGAGAGAPREITTLT